MHLLAGSGQSSRHRGQLFATSRMVCSIMSKSTEETYFVITYREPEEGKVLNLKAKTVTDSSLGLSFISVSDFIFDTGALVVNPAEEELKKRFEDVKALHISIYMIISISEKGTGSRKLEFKKDKSNLVILSSEHQPKDH